MYIPTLFLWYRFLATPSYYLSCRSFFPCTYFLLYLEPNTTCYEQGTKTLNPSGKNGNKLEKQFVVENMLALLQSIVNAWYSSITRPKYVQKRLSNFDYFFIYAFTDNNFHHQNYVPLNIGNTKTLKLNITHAQLRIHVHVSSYQSI